MTMSCVYFTLGLTFFATLIWFCCAKKRAVSHEKKYGYKKLRARLTAYARMKQPSNSLKVPPTNIVSVDPYGMMLSPCEHEILLGILKKIEAKYTAFSVVIIFALTMLTTLTFSTVDDLKIDALFLAGALGVMIAMLWTSLEGANHLGQNHFSKHVYNLKPSLRGRELQRSLIHDMLKKESMFHEFFKTTVLVLILLVAASVFNAIGTH